MPRNSGAPHGEAIDVPYDCKAGRFALGRRCDTCDTAELGDPLFSHGLGPNIGGAHDVRVAFERGGEHMLVARRIHGLHAISIYPNGAAAFVADTRCTLVKAAQPLALVRASVTMRGAAVLPVVSGDGVNAHSLILNANAPRVSKALHLDLLALLAAHQASRVVGKRPWRSSLPASCCCIVAV